MNEFEKERMGWIKLQRAIMHGNVFTNPTVFKIYIWCLIKANHSSKFISIKTGKGSSEIKVKRGRFITGRFRASEELQIAPSTFTKNLNKLVSMGQIKKISNSHYTEIEVIGYDRNQSPKEQADSTTKNK